MLSCREELSRYIIKEREEIFTGAQRSHIVWQILLRTPYDTARPDKAGIVRLMNISAAKYPDA